MTVAHNVGLVEMLLEAREQTQGSQSRAEGGIPPNGEGDIRTLSVAMDPRPEDTITEAGGEVDVWAGYDSAIASLDPGDDDTITKQDGEHDIWAVDPMDPRPEDTITRADGETDKWGLNTVARMDPRPPRPEDIITLDEGETDSWTAGA